MEETKVEEIKSVDFTHIEIEGISGDKQALPKDYYKGLANMIYNQTKDLGEVEFARKLYKHGQIEITKKESEMVNKYMADQPYIIKEAFKKLMEF